MGPGLQVALEQGGATLRWERRGGGGLAGSVSLCAVPVFLPGWAAPVRTLSKSRDAPVKCDSERPGAGGVADRRIRLAAEVGRRRARKRSDEEREGNVHVGETPSLA